MSNIKISQLSNITYSAYTPEDLLVIVNYKDSVDGITKNTKISDIKDYVLSGVSRLSAIHFPHSEDKCGPGFSFPVGIKQRVSLYDFLLYVDSSGSESSPPPGYDPNYYSFGLVYGDSSIKSEPSKPKVVNGFEERNVYSRTTISTETFQMSTLETIRSFFSNYVSSEVQMEYLYHEGQISITNKPKVYFDNGYLTVDSLNCDVIEDTSFWYVIKDIGGTGISLSIEFFLTNVESLYYPYTSEYPECLQESMIKKIFTEDSINRDQYNETSILFFQTINDLYYLANQNPINCTGINDLKNNLSVYGNNLIFTYQVWYNEESYELFNFIDDTCIGNGMISIFQNAINRITNLRNIIGEEKLTLASEVDVFSCQIQDSFNNLWYQSYCGNYIPNASNDESIASSYTNETLRTRTNPFNLFKNMFKPLNNPIIDGLTNTNNEEFIKFFNKKYLEQYRTLDLKSAACNKALAAITSLNPDFFVGNFNSFAQSLGC